MIFRARRDPEGQLEIAFQIDFWEMDYGRDPNGLARRINLEGPFRLGTWYAHPVPDDLLEQLEESGAMLDFKLFRRPIDRRRLELWKKGALGQVDSID